MTEDQAIRAAEASSPAAVAHTVEPDLGQAVDLSAFKQSFLEEPGERIAALERGLLHLESVPNDSEELNAIFRAAHSVKGAAGSLGFTDAKSASQVASAKTAADIAATRIASTKRECDCLQR